jgi:hypothetical protein
VTGSLDAIVAVVVAALFAQREMLRALDGPASRRAVKAMGVVCWPLLAFFALSMAVRFGRLL